MITKLQIEQIVGDLMRESFPRTQEDCCRIAAHVDIVSFGLPTSMENQFMRAHCIARGLFGDAFEKADDGQRWTWIDMCERALADVIAEAKQ